eukprot:TRINITY_DN22255_c0_g3_i1.p1 TRINITY_DN22255_c0_g3~~TRINITY_DN22255_c0_g3_i1.p1  ORF type:complete len:528 (+),score=45.67 TRINITY_DN22255_c0_g3_i1:99-1682(+)
MCSRCGDRLTLQQPGLWTRYVRCGDTSNCDSCAQQIRGSEKRWKCVSGRCGFSLCETCRSTTTPISADISGRARLRPACMYGSRCIQVSPDHLDSFSHPGDYDYRSGCVAFKDGTTPEFESLWDIFAFFDPASTGNLSLQYFREAARVIGGLSSTTIDHEAAWEALGGVREGHVGFVGFASWGSLAGAKLPVVLDTLSGLPQPCRFARPEGREDCKCKDFQASVVGGKVCKCGHREHEHKSDIAEQSLAAQLLTSKPIHWTQGISGLVELRDSELLTQLQFLLDATHKESDNWTRDRGCKLHGVNRCKPECIHANRAPVPKGYKLIRAFRNQNLTLWARYRLMRSAIMRDCGPQGCERRTVQSSQPTFHQLGSASAPLVEGVNEWWLFHGTAGIACLNICEKNFLLQHAGTGATWRKPGEPKGLPLYGHGVYFSENITKADEYAKLESAGGQTFCHVLLCRVVGGRANVYTKNEIDAEGLRRQIFHGPHHSVLGDRVQDLKKPYREIVIYDADQIYPAFLLTYARVY